jgi:hypothetical protein
MKSLQLDLRSRGKIAEMNWSMFIGVKHRMSAVKKDVSHTPNIRMESVIVGKMNTSSIRFKVAQSNAKNVRNCGQNEWHAYAMKKEKEGMTPTPPWVGDEIARRRAHGLLVGKSKGEPNAGWCCAHKRAATLAGQN